MISLIISLLYIAFCGDEVRWMSRGGVTKIQKGYRPRRRYRRRPW